MSKNSLDDLILGFKYLLGICQHAGCWRQDATACRLPDENMQAKPDSVKPDYFYCSEHAHRQGFCYICGEFWAGIESLVTIYLTIPFRDRMGVWTTSDSRFGFGSRP